MEHLSRQKVMDPYQTAILDAMGIARHSYKDPSVQAFAAQPMLKDLQVAMPHLRFVLSDQVALEDGIVKLPASPSAQHKRDIWLAYCQHSHEQ